MTVRVLPPSVAPAAAGVIVVLPFDPARLLDSLAAAVPTPAPAFPALEAELRRFIPPPAADLGPAGREWAATRDSVLRLADSLRAADRRSPGYRAAYDRFRALYRRLAARGAAREARARELTDEVRELARRAGRAADSLRRWEERAFAAFDSLAAVEIARTGRTPVRAVPAEDGVAHLALAHGRWWITLRLPHPDNPFLEYAWNVPVVSRAGLPLGVPLDEVNAELRWRH